MENTATNLIDSRKTDRFSDYLFWDVDKAKIDLQRHRALIIRRVFELGTLDDLVESLVFYGYDTVRETLITADNLGENAVDLAAALFNLTPSYFNASRRNRF